MVCASRRSKVALNGDIRHVGIIVSYIKLPNHDSSLFVPVFIEKKKYQPNNFVQ